jgi:hypothetical protein
MSLITSSLLTKRNHASFRKGMTSVQQRNQWEQYWLTKLSDNMATVARCCLNGVHAKKNGNWEASCIHDANGIGRITSGYTRLSTKFMQSKGACLWLCLLLLNTHIKTTNNKAMFNQVKLLRVIQYCERIYQEKPTFIHESTPRKITV